ncbi:PPE family protein [Mycobacterium sp. M1]|uniref:PPE family protein n=1 Tax=Mycolicibacter acidiphilus TaxID=2835306 RepID=A0ABS5RNY9_9MYCO|nr:PPE domain-containing protein [Mycolicibacter acidiphilus]MBS9536023.1 PPE family protein [Mycolicibacter acidiphilus]
MSAPVWLASPPEVHSTLLSAGPGPGPLLATAAAWSALSAEYTEVAAELDGLLAGVQAGAWQGPSAQQYTAAHGPYLAWLSERAAQGATAAGLHQTAAAAYTTALATMPTLAELAANHAVHTALVATNFFGVNTIPIALNEADYVRMWVQAAETMSVYSAVAGSAQAAVPTATPAPPILAPTAAASSAASAADPNWDQQIADWLTKFNMGFADPIAKWLWAQLGVNGYPIEAFPFATAVSQMLMHIPGMSPVLAGALGWSTFHTLMLLWPLGQIAVQMAIPIVMAAAPALAAAAGLAGLSGLSGLAGLPVDGDLKLPAAPAMPVPAGGPVASIPASGAAPAAGAAAGGVSTPGTANPVMAQPMGDCGGPTPCPPDCSCGPTTGMPEGFYLVGSVGASAQRRAVSRRARRDEAAAPDELAEELAADADAPARRKRARRQRGATSGAHGNRHEYLDSGAGSAGFAGAALKSGVHQPTGITRLDDAVFAGGVTAPMLPSSWGERD